MSADWLKVIVAGCAVASLGFVGCGGMKSGAGPKEEHHAKDGHDHHPTEGPHKGHLIELGKEEFHAELTHEEESKTVKVYILDGEAKAAVPIDATDVTINVVTDGKPQQVKLPAAPQSGDPAGKSSAFAVIHAELLEAVEKPKTKGRLNVTVKGKPYVGEITDLDDHDHK